MFGIEEFLNAVKPVNSSPEEDDKSLQDIIKKPKSKAKADKKTSSKSTIKHKDILD